MSNNTINTDLESIERALSIIPNDSKNIIILRRNRALFRVDRLIAISEPNNPAEAIAMVKQDHASHAISLRDPSGTVRSYTFRVLNPVKY